MQRRYRHFLTPLDRATGPGVVVCVGVSGTLSEPDAQTGTRTETLTGWTADVLSKRRKVYCRVASASGLYDYEWWHWLEHAFGKEKRIEIVSYNCTRVWSLLRMWEELEDGRIELSIGPVGVGSIGHSALPDMRPNDSGPNRSTTAGPVRPVRSSGGGIACLEDPPCIAQLYCPTAGNRYTWWDIRNWGVGPDPTPAGDSQPSAGVSNWYKALASLAKVEGLGPPTVTAASWSMKSYRLKYYKGGVYMHTHSVATEIESAAYHGGRCECWRMGKQEGDGWLVDVRGAYLYAAWAAALPCRLDYVRTNPDIREVTHHPSDKAIIARVLIETARPISPVRNGHDTVYPVGRYWASLCGPELALARLNGQIVSVSHLAVYSTSPALRQWAEAMHDMRTRAELAGVPGVAAAMKMAGVSLIGKLAQRRKGWERSPQGDGRLWYGDCWAQGKAGRPVRIRWVAGQCYEQVDRGWATEANVAMAAWITSIARERLWEIACLAGIGNVWYLDTDAVICNRAGYDRLLKSPLPWGKVIGGLSVRHGPAPVEIYGLKHYRIGDHVVCAGTPRGVLTQSGDPGRHWYTPATGEQIRGRARPTADQRRIVWPQSESYRHGVVNGDGSVSPLELWEDL